jgi:hypothetical protein
MAEEVKALTRARRELAKARKTCTITAELEAAERSAASSVSHGKLHARVHAHRDAVELSRKLVARGA